MMAVPMAEFTSAETTVIGVYLLILSIIGIVSNGIVIYLYITTKTLRTPINVLFVSLTLGDFTVSLFGTLTSALFTFTRTAMGQGMCEFYGFITFLGGSADALALTAIAVERYLTVARPFGIGNMSYHRAAFWLGYTWIFAAIEAGVPLVGVSSYISEGAGTWCSIDWQRSRVITDVYIVIIFIMTYFLPIVIIIVSYYGVMAKVNQVAKNGASSSSVKTAKSVSKQVVIMVAGYLIGWTPYAIVCIVTTVNNANPFSPKVAMAPAMFAKTSFCYNPFIYVALNKQFRKAFFQKILCGYNPEDKKVKAGQDQSSKVTLGDTKFALPEVVTMNTKDKGAGPSVLKQMTGASSKVAPSKY